MSLCKCSSRRGSQRRDDCRDDVQTRGRRGGGRVPFRDCDSWHMVFMNTSSDLKSPSPSPAGRSVRPPAGGQSNTFRQLIVIKRAVTGDERDVHHGVQRLCFLWTLTVDRRPDFKTGVKNGLLSNGRDFMKSTIEEKNSRRICMKRRLSLSLSPSGLPVHPLFCPAILPRNRLSHLMPWQ